MAANRRAAAKRSSTSRPASPISGRIRDSAGATKPGQRPSASPNHRPPSSSQTRRSTSDTSAKGASASSGSPPARATNVDTCCDAAASSVVLPMPGSPVTTSSPPPASRWRRTTRSSARRPAMVRAGGGRCRAPSAVAASQRSRKSAGSPPTAGTTISTSDHAGSRGCVKRWCTVVCEHPARRAMARRLGCPASSCRRCSASTRSRCGPGSSSGWCSRPIGPPRGSSSGSTRAVGLSRFRQAVPARSSVAAAASASGTCCRASLRARPASRIATVPRPSRRATCAPRHRQ